MYGINEKVYKKLIDYFEKNKDVEQVIIFGSRAKNMTNINSDIDMCIDYKGSRRGNIIYEIDEIIGIYSCDILFKDTLNQEIKSQIDRDGLIFYSIGKSYFAKEK